MTQAIIYPNGTKTVTVPIGQYIMIAAYEGAAKIYLGVDDSNMPVTFSFSQEIENEDVTLGTYSVLQQVKIDAGAGKVIYDVGASPSISQSVSDLTPVSTTTTSGQMKAAGLFALNTAQVLDMSDAAVQLTVNTATTAGTLLTSNVMMIDPNSSGAGEDLELPPEADVPGIVLWIYNTGGENIVVKDDSGGTTIDTIATTEFGFFFCDGTAWHGMNVA
ncbi:MAG: hypothetical protein KJP07_23240 [Desulfatitalea sp.]|nr:hypothetical protein [Desulfatitalea sp.]